MFSYSNNFQILVFFTWIELLWSTNEAVQDAQRPVEVVLKLQSIVHLDL